MSKQTTTKAHVELPTQNYVEKTHNKTYLATDEQIENTPFVLRWREEKGWFLTIGAARITEPTKTAEETITKLETNKWEIIAGMIVHVTNLLLKNPNMELYKSDNMTEERK